MRSLTGRRGMVLCLLALVTVVALVGVGGRIALRPANTQRTAWSVELPECADHLMFRGTNIAIITTTNVTHMPVTALPVCASAKLTIKPGQTLPMMVWFDAETKCASQVCKVRLVAEAAFPATVVCHKDDLQDRDNTSVADTTCDGQAIAGSGTWQQFRAPAEIQDPKSQLTLKMYQLHDAQCPKSAPKPGCKVTVGLLVDEGDLDIDELSLRIAALDHPKAA